MFEEVVSCGLSSDAMGFKLKLFFSPLFLANVLCFVRRSELQRISVVNTVGIGFRSINFLRFFRVKFERLAVSASKGFEEAFVIYVPTRISVKFLFGCAWEQG